MQQYDRRSRAAGTFEHLRASLPGVLPGRGVVFVAGDKEDRRIDRDQQKNTDDYHGPPTLEHIASSLTPARASQGGISRLDRESTPIVTRTVWSKLRRQTQL